MLGDEVLSCVKEALCSKVLSTSQQELVPEAAHDLATQKAGKLRDP